MVKPATPYAALGERLRLERERLGYTQAALAKAMALSRKTQVNYEIGLREPGAAYLARLAALGGDLALVVTGRTAEPAAAVAHDLSAATALDVQSARRGINELLRLLAGVSLTLVDAAKRLEAVNG